MLNWLKSGKLSGVTSKVKVSDEGGEEPIESEESEATEERIATDPGEENEQESENDEPKRKGQEGKRGEEGEHQTGKKRRKYGKNYLGLGDADCPKPKLGDCVTVFQINSDARAHCCDDFIICVLVI